MGAKARCADGPRARRILAQPLVLPLEWGMQHYPCTARAIRATRPITYAIVCIPKDIRFVSRCPLLGRPE
jgi:hypothetical protein